jgi:CubicO group peptidase (beta-lactamase class C family)
MKLHGILIASLLSACATTAQTTVQTPDQAAQIDAMFAGISKDGPGCVIGITQDGKTVIEKAYGLAVLEHDVPNTTATLFEIGSVSKQFTAAAVLLLERDGKLKLFDDIRKYLPEMPDYGTPITIEMLLDHRSGLRDWGSIANAAGKPRGERNFSNTEVLDIAARQAELNYKPGSAYSYTNTGYNLAATIVERLSGKSFMAFTKERIFDPLGMTSAQWRDDFNRIVKNRAMAYEPSGDGFEQAMPFMDVYGNGGLIMTNGDLTRWNEAMIADTLGIRAAMETRAMLSDGRKLPYARGVNVVPYNGVTEVYHGGVTGGYNAWLSRFPDRRLSIAMTCNTSPPRAATPAALASVFLGPTPKSVAATGLPDPAQYAGLFMDTRTGVPFEVTSNAGELMMNGRPLTRISATQWKRGNDTNTFVNADKFEIEGFDGNLYTFVRTPAVALPVSMFGEYAGSYASDETLATYQVAVESGQLKVRIEGWPDTILTLSAVYRDAFEADGLLVRFRRGPDGKVTEMSLGDSRMWDLRAARVT